MKNAKGSKILYPKEYLNKLNNMIYRGPIGYKCTDSFWPLTCKKDKNWRPRICTFKDYNPITR